MANDNETVEQVYEEMKEVTGIRRFIDSHYCNHCGDQIDGEGSALDVYADRILAAHNREIDELKTQIKIAKDAFFNISMCDHSQKIHDIFCEAEFMMNHPEARRIENGNE